MALMTITIQGEKQVIAVLESMRARASNLTPAMKSIGALVKNESLGNFKSQHGPDGTPWAPLKMSTLIARAMRLSGGKGIKTKKGAMKKGAQRVISTGKILLDTGVLRASVQVQDTSATSVTIASRIKYAATQQYGAKSGQFGVAHYKSRNGTFPIPWGDIPARPFLGTNPQMRTDIADIIRAHLMPAA